MEDRPIANSWYDSAARRALGRDVRISTGILATWWSGPGRSTAVKYLEAGTAHTVPHAHHYSHHQGCE